MSTTPPEVDPDRAAADLVRIYEKSLFVERLKLNHLQCRAAAKEAKDAYDDGVASLTRLIDDLRRGDAGEADA